ncbi:MAG: GerMN domain-containing protein, partial [Candidatus Muiribacteriaceae bacterium]
MSDTFGFFKFFLKLLWLAVICVAGYFLFFYEVEDFTSDIPAKYLPDNKNAATYEHINMTFYYTDGIRLISEDRQVTLADNPIEMVDSVIKEYLKGPANTDLFLTLPEKTKVRNFFITDNVLYLDISREIRTNSIGGIVPELLAIYGVVNTVCQINTVNGVKFLLNGEDTDILISHLDTS